MFRYDLLFPSFVLYAADEVAWYKRYASEVGLASVLFPLVWELAKRIKPARSAT
jgi:hypothetical protein